MRPKKTKGRQKIRMEKMAKQKNLLVTFSKRRSGLFKKASELCILCGVEISIIVLSPHKNVYSFGHPSVESIVDRFLAQSPETSSSTSQLINAHRNASVYELNAQLTNAIDQLEMEKKKSEELSNILAEGRNNHWWRAPIESQGLQELEKFKVALGWMKMSIEEQKKHVATNQLALVPISAPSGIGGDYNQVMGSGHDITMTSNGYMLGYEHFSG